MSEYFKPYVIEMSGFYDGTKESLPPESVECIIRVQNKNTPPNSREYIYFGGFIKLYNWGPCWDGAIMRLPEIGDEWGIINRTKTIESLISASMTAMTKKEKKPRAKKEKSDGTN